MLPPRRNHTATLFPYTTRFRSVHAAFTPGCVFIHDTGRRLALRPTPFVQESSMKRIIPLALLALFSANFLVACNTVKGAAKDVQKVGQQVEEAADDTGAADPR